MVQLLKKAAIPGARNNRDDYIHHSSRFSTNQGGHRQLSTSHVFQLFQINWMKKEYQDRLDRSLEYETGSQQQKFHRRVLFWQPIIHQFHPVKEPFP